MNQRQKLSRTAKKLSESPNPGRRKDVILDFHKYCKKSRTLIQSPLPYSPGILISARYLQATPPTGQAVQSINSVTKRLHRGARLSANSSYQQDSMSRIADIVSHQKEVEYQRMFSQEEEIEFEQFINGITFLKDIKFDLDVNYNIARQTNYEQKFDEKLGQYYYIMDTLKQKNIIQDLKDIPQINEVTLQLTKMIRDILRRIIQQGAYDEAVLLESFWRLVIKLFDKGIGLNQKNAKHNEDTIALIARINKHNYESQLQQIRQANDKQVNLLQAHITKLNNTITKLKTDKRHLEKKLRRTENRIAELTEQDQQTQSIRDMQKLFRELNKTIKMTEGEYERQAETLLTISNVMELAEKYEDKPAIFEAESQTN